MNEQHIKLIEEEVRTKMTEVSKVDRSVIVLRSDCACICLGFTCINGVDSTGSGVQQKNIKLGLDLAGGVSITYQTVEERSVCRETWQIRSTSCRSVWKSYST